MYIGRGTISALARLQPACHKVAGQLMPLDFFKSYVLYMCVFKESMVLFLVIVLTLVLRLILWIFEMVFSRADSEFSIKMLFLIESSRFCKIEMFCRKVSFLVTFFSFMSGSSK